MWGGGVPHPDLGWGTPHQQNGVPPHPELGWGTPLFKTWDGVLLIQAWDGVPPQSRPVMGCLLSRCGLSHKVKKLPSHIPPISRTGYPPLFGPGMGYPPSRPGMGTPCPDLGWGTPPVQMCDGVPPMVRCGLSHKVKILPSPSFGCGR